MRYAKIAVGIIAITVLIIDGEMRTALAIVAIATMIAELEQWKNERKSLK
jgi:hypothetical protein